MRSTGLSSGELLDPRPRPNRSPEDVPLTIVGNADLAEFGEALATAQACAIDTETVYSKSDPSNFIGPLRVVSAATRSQDGNADGNANGSSDRSWVVDVRAVDKGQLARALAGVKADAWNANFDAHVIERDLFGLTSATTSTTNPAVAKPTSTTNPAVAKPTSTTNPAVAKPTSTTNPAVAEPTSSPLVPPIWWDVMLSDALLHQGLSGFDFYHSLAWASEWYLGLQAQGKGTTQTSFTADGELSDEQLRYAAADAVETLWIGQIVRERLAEAGLEQICQLEQGARPFLDQMQRSGLAVDQEGWKVELQHLEQRRQELMTRLAELTGGGQGGLFDQQLKPNWNPNSEHDVRLVLNQHEHDRVERWALAEFGEKRQLNETDSLNAMVLNAIGGEICEALLAFRDATKVVSTYGEGLLSFVRSDGRFHSNYLQVVGTNTGRLASRNPNAQNLTPRLKPYIHPARGGVFVYADLSQAELRFAAQIADDKKLQEAFELGLDIHDATATSMFDIDMTQLRSTDPAQHDLMRTKAKRINFGILYGLRATGLARTLTEDGVWTERHEAEELINTYLATYPGVGDWVRARDEFITDLAAATPEVDWPLTLRLHLLWPQVNLARRQLREELHRHCVAEEIDARLRSSTVVGGAPSGERSEPGEIDVPANLAETAWCLSFSAPVVIGADGQPVRINSRTLAGRRQQFTLRIDGLLETAAEIVAESPKPQPRKAWELALSRTGLATPFIAGSTAAAGGTSSTATTSGTSSTAAGGGTNTAGMSTAAMSSKELAKLLENRPLRRAVIDVVGETMGADNQAVLLNRALSSRIERLANAYRNAPIQGGVADVMLDAFARLHNRLGAIEGAKGVQTVHDSVVVECLESDADKVAALVRDTLEEAMQHWCPNVPAVVDTDIRTSLSDKDIVRTI